MAAGSGSGLRQNGDNEAHHDRAGTGSFNVSPVVEMGSSVVGAWLTHLTILRVVPIEEGLDDVGK